jgi:hypothetical protein
MDWLESGVFWAVRADACARARVDVATEKRYFLCRHA